MAAEKKACALCLKKKTLLRSHIIPRSFFRMAKSGESYLLKLEEDGCPRGDNADLKERLLCAQCEEFLNVSYERESVAFLTGRSKKEVIRSERGVTLVGLDYRKLYLFWLSVFWRAGVSGLPEFRAVEAAGELWDIFRVCIISNDTKISGVDISDFVCISMARSVFLSDENGGSRGMISNIQRVRGDGVGFVLLVCGLVVHFGINTSQGAGVPKDFTRIRDTNFLRLKSLNPYTSEVMESVVSSLFHSIK